MDDPQVGVGMAMEWLGHRPTMSVISRDDKWVMGWAEDDEASDEMDITSMSKSRCAGLKSSIATMWQVNADYWSPA
eukprot:57403-Pelagomonas_calceolata.AAC.9